MNPLASTVGSTSEEDPETFSMLVRDETDLDALSDDLVGVVRETMQPSHVSLWLHPDPALKDKKKRAAIQESGRDEE
jgi:hypothetical protein